MGISSSARTFESPPIGSSSEPRGRVRTDGVGGVVEGKHHLHPSTSHPFQKGLTLLYPNMQHLSSAC